MSLNVLARMGFRPYRESVGTVRIPTSIGPLFIGAEPRRRCHYRGVIEEVIERDCYGVRSLYAEGFQPEIIVDVGMHIGTFSLLCHCLWPDARIIGIEIMRNEYACGSFARAIVRSLDANICDKDAITVIRKALVGFYGSFDADVVHGEDFGRSKPWPEDSIRAGTHPWADAMSVREFLQSGNIDRIDLLKLDVEGSEVNILRELNALDMLRNIHVIRGEWHFDIARTEVQRLLSPTHDVTVEWNGPGDDWNMFTAVRR